MPPDTAAATPNPQAPPRREVSLAVRVENLWKRFPVRRSWRDAIRHPFRREHVVALAGVSCEVRPGEFFGLLGPNGAGKTTLFKVLATLIDPDAGRAEICGHELQHSPAAVRRVLTPAIADERSLYWRLSAVENLRLFAALHGLPREATASRAAELLALVGLDHTGHAMVGTFSSGMRQRLLVARALLARPRVLLLDEPTRSLDPLSARHFRTFLREQVAGRDGCAILLATHNTDEALELCDRVAVLHRGRLLASGPAAELARTFGEDRYRLWTTSPAHPALAGLTETVSTVRNVAVLRVDDDGWTAVEMTIRGGPAEAAEALSALVTAGVPVARFERVAVSLAELIERVIAREEEQP